MRPSFHEVGAAQFGLVTKEQAREYLTRRELERRIRTGQLVWVRRGVFRCEGVPPSWRQHLLAVCLSAGPPMAASHRAAARLFELEGFETAKLEVTVQRGRCGRLGGKPDTIVHSAELPPADITKVFGIPTTTAIRTIIDLSAVVTDDVQEKALDDALRRRLFTIEELDRRLKVTNAGGRRRLTSLRRLINARGTDYQAGESKWEDRIYHWLVGAGYPAPTRQHSVTLNGSSRRIDLAYPDLKIAIEFDGWDYHRTRRKFDDDRARVGELQLANWLVLQFTSKNTQQEVLGKVGQARAQRVQSAQRAEDAGAPPR